jgi:UDP-3-O-[3-hydroxymyristoyl] glucosamine N-acyltransferase
MIFDSVINIESVLSDLDIEYTTDSNDLSRNHKYVRKVASINKSTGQDLTYCSSKDVKSTISSTSKAQARVILCDNSLARIASRRKKLQRLLGASYLWKILG